MKRLLLLGAAGLLGACASKAPELANDDAARMFAGTMQLAPLPQSLMREGDRLSFMLLQPKTEATPFAFLAQVEASCSTTNASLVYLDGGKRVYFASPDGQYMPPRPMPQRQAEVLAANPAFKQACSATAQPDWRVLKGSGDEQWVLVDRNSLARDGDSLQFWSAFDSPAIGHDMPYNAPYAQKREHYSVDCAKQTFSLLAGYDVDEKGSVTDGGVFFEPKRYSVNGSDADYQLLFKAACAVPNGLAQLPAFKGRNRAAAQGKLPSVQAPVLSAVKQLNLPAAGKPLRHLVETGEATLQDKTASFREERFLQPDKATGQLAIRSKGGTFEGEAVSFRGLLPLAQRTVYSGSAPMVDTSSLSGLSFTGNWREMPVGAQLGYVTHGKMSNSLVGAYGKERVAYSCKVEARLPASQVNVALSGQAKHLRCAQLEDPYKRVDSVYYLEDYGYFLRAGTDPNAFFYEKRVLQTAE